MCVCNHEGEAYGCVEDVHIKPQIPVKQPVLKLYLAVVPVIVFG